MPLFLLLFRCCCCRCSCLVLNMLHWFLVVNVSRYKIHTNWMHFLLCKTFTNVTLWLPQRRQNNKYWGRSLKVLLKSPSTDIRMKLNYYSWFLDGCFFFVFILAFLVRKAFIHHHHSCGLASLILCRVFLFEASLFVVDDISATTLLLLLLPLVMMFKMLMITCSQNCLKVD